MKKARAGERKAAPDAASVLGIWESAATELVFSLDAEQRFLFASRAARELLGTTPSALRGSRFVDRASAQDQAAVTAWLASIVAGAAAPPLVHRFCRRDGSELWVETSARRVPAPRGRAPGGAPRGWHVHGACRDIDRHKRFELTVERVAQQWRATVDAASDGILMLDAGLRVIRLNRSAADLFRLRYTELLDQDVRELLAARLGLREDLGLAAAVVSGERRAGDIWFPRRRRWLHSQAAPMRDRDGAIVGVVLVLRDVTDRRRAELRLERSHEQLRSLSAHFEQASELSRAELAREIHDELGALLTALKLDLAWIEGKLGPEAEALRVRARAAVEVSDRAVAAVRRIASELHPSVLDALGLPAAVEWHCRELQKRSGLDVQVEVPSAELFLEGALATSLFRILQEATTNVVRHAQARHLAVRLWQERGALCLRVQDDGHGFDRRKLAAARGVGLGLFGMEERGEMIGARVTIRSRPGDGTVVTVRRRLQS